MDRQPSIKGALVELRPLRTDDFSALYRVATDPMIWEQHPSKDRCEQEVFAGWFDDALGSGGALAVVDIASNELVGSTRFDVLTPDRSEVEIGWTFLARDHWGGPYNAEIKRLMLRHAFQFVETVVFKVHSQNLRSQRAVETLGAVRVGAEPDAHGRGENYIFRLDGSGSSWMT